MQNMKGIIFYIAGPITGIEGGNKPMFKRAQVWLEEMGAITLNPSVLPHGLRSHQSYMNICMPMLREASALVLLPGWHNSVGARMEYEEARRLGMPVCQFAPDQDPDFQLLSEAKNGK